MNDNPEQITIRDAMANGFRWGQMGWNHKVGVPLLAPLGIIASFAVNKLDTLLDLEKLKRLNDFGYVPVKWPEAKLAYIGTTPEKWERMKADLAALRAFAKEMVDSSWMEDIEDLNIQGTARKHGLLDSDKPTDRLTG